MECGGRCGHPWSMMGYSRATPSARACWSSLRHGALLLPPSLWLRNESGHQAHRTWTSAAGQAQVRPREARRLPDDLWGRPVLPGIQLPARHVAACRALRDVAPCGGDPDAEGAHRTSALSSTTRHPRYPTCPSPCIAHHSPTRRTVRHRFASLPAIPFCATHICHPIRPWWKSAKPCARTTPRCGPGSMSS